MASSEEDLRSKRGGHLLFDHSSFPDAVILRFRDKNFVISASYLALHSHFFNNLFYGPNSTGLNGRYEFDFDPVTFGDLLDIIYPSYKKTNCCVDCSSSLANRLDLALQFEMKLAVKRLLNNKSPDEDIMRILQKHNAVASYSFLFGNKRYAITDDMVVERETRHSLEPIAVSANFPDSTMVSVGGMSMLVSATALSLHSTILNKMLNTKEKRSVVVKIDVNPHSFITFLESISGDLPTEYTVILLDDLLTLGAKHLYEYVLPKIRKKLTYSICSSQPFSQYAMQLLEHYCNLPDLDLDTIQVSKYHPSPMDSMTIVACCLSIDQLEEVLSKCPSLSPSVKDGLRRSVKSVVEIQVFVKSLNGLTALTFVLPRGVHTSVEELKMRYEQKEGIPPDQFRMIFGGSQLEAGKTLGSYKIKKESTIDAVLRLRGLVVSFLPYNPTFNNWQDCFEYLRHHGLKRGARLFLREQTGAVSVGMDQQFYAANKHFA